jgi:hypothetical protein
MPNPEGRLTPDEKKQAVQWVESHQNGDLTCPICKTAKWTIQEHLVSLNVFVPGGLPTRGPKYPQIQLVCDNCGFTLLVNAVRAGMKLAGFMPVNLPQLPKADTNVP